MKRIAIALILLMASSAFGAAAKWETKTFDADTAKGLEELNAYCTAHDVKAEDVLWANHTTEQEIASGTTIYLPANQAELLAIWQHVGAWKPTALVPVTSGAAARRLIEPEVKPRRTTVSLSALPNVELPKTDTPKLPNVDTPKVPSVETPKMPNVDTPKVDTPKLPSVETPKVPNIDTPKVPNVETPKLPNVETPKTDTLKAAAAQTQLAKKTKTTPAKVIAQTAKPDKILTAKKKSTQEEIPGLMDPIIVLSPNGDANNGPMRLIISGDKVEVVRLPQNAVPKNPAASDINEPFTSSYSYLSFYSAPARAKASNNTLMTNLTNINTLSGKMMWPVDGKISSPFGKWRGKHKHEGIDIPMPAGTPIRAARNGVVERTGNNSTIGFRGYGNFVMVDHGGGVKTFYAHCSSVAVAQGQRVMQGQVIAYVGSTGRSTANHLHFEVRINNAKVNPVPYLAGNSQLASHK